MSTKSTTGNATVALNPAAIEQAAIALVVAAQPNNSPESVGAEFNRNPSARDHATNAAVSVINTYLHALSAEARIIHGVDPTPREALLRKTLSDLFIAQRDGEPSASDVAEDVEHFACSLAMLYGRMTVPADLAIWPTIPEDTLNLLHTQAKQILERELRIHLTVQATGHWPLEMVDDDVVTFSAALYPQMTSIPQKGG